MKTIDYLLPDPPDKEDDSTDVETLGDKPDIVTK